MSQFDVEWPSDEEKSGVEDPLARLAFLDLDTLSVEEIEATLGPELLKKFQDSLGSAGGGDLLDQVTTKAVSWRPWWDRPVQPVMKDSSSDLLSDFDEPPALPTNLPPFNKLSQAIPSEFFWNNLAELLFAYSYLSNLYLGTLNGYEDEVSFAYLSLSQVLSEPNLLHHAAIEALSAVIRRVKASPTLANPDVFLGKTVEDLIVLYRRPEDALRALNHVYTLIRRAAPTNRQFFLASKKVYFYLVWFHSELTNNFDLVEDIFTSMIMIFGGVHDRLVR